MRGGRAKGGAGRGWRLGCFKGRRGGRAFFCSCQQPDVIINICDCMTAEREYVISLTRLTLPSGNLPSKVTVSLLADGSEQFIAKDRVVRGGKVNLFRQSLFLPTAIPSFQLRLYSLDHAKPLLLCSFPVPPEQLLSLARYPAMFHISRQGYELVWEGALFCDDSDEANEPTERDYSELAMPLNHPESQHSHSYSPTWLDEQPAGPKRPSSTEASSCEELQSRSQAVRDELSLSARRPKLDKSTSARPGQFKSQVYSSFLNSLNGLFAASSC